MNAFIVKLIKEKYQFSGIEAKRLAEKLIEEVLEIEKSRLMNEIYIHQYESLDGEYMDPVCGAEVRADRFLKYKYKE